MEGEPTLEKQGSKYLVKWKTKGVEMEVGSIDPKARYACEVAVKIQGFPITRAYPTLKSMSGFQTFVRHLKNRSDEVGFTDINWGQIVEDFTGIVIDTHRAGVPAIKLNEVDLSENVRWRVDNVALEGEVSLIYANGGTGKSFFSLWLATLVQEGYMSSNHGLVVEPGNVLYLDYETKPEEIAHRSRMIHAGLGIDTADSTTTSSQIVYNQCGQPFVDEEDYIQDLIYKHNISLVVIDSMGRAVSGELESADTVVPFFAAVKRLNTTVLVVSHTNKQGQLFGSQYTYNEARLIWEAKKTGSTTTGMEFSLVCRKANNVPFQPPQAYGVDFSPDLAGNEMAIYNRTDVFVTDIAGDMSYRDLIFRILKEDGAKSKEYIKNTIKTIKGDPPDRIERNVDSAVSKMKGGGHVVENDGVLQLPDITEETDSEWETI